MRKLGQMIETLRRKWVKQLGVENVASFVMYSKPIPVVGYRRSKRHSNFGGSADADAIRPSRREGQVRSQIALFNLLRKF